MSLTVATALLTLAILLVANIAVTVAVRRAAHFSVTQKAAQLSLVWFLPAVGAPAEVPKKYEHDHLAFLRMNQAELIIAGGLREAPGGSFVRGLWVREVPSYERARELVETDPYFIDGKRSYKIRVWGKALTEKQVVL